jgi:hypothetical protein
MMDSFLKKSHMSNFMKILSLGTMSSVRTDGETYMMKIVVAFQNVAKVPKSEA